MNGLDQYMMQQYAQQQTPQNPMAFWQGLFGGPPQQTPGKPGAFNPFQAGQKMMQQPQETDAPPQPFTPQQKPQPQQPPPAAMYPYFGGVPMASQMQRPPPQDPRMRRR